MKNKLFLAALLVCMGQTTYPIRSFVLLFFSKHLCALRNTMHCRFSDIFSRSRSKLEKRHFVPQIPTTGGNSKKIKVTFVEGQPENYPIEYSFFKKNIRHKDYSKKSKPDFVE